MARIPEEEIEALKLRVDLVAMIQSKGIELKRHGASDLVGHCPFHDDRSPSLVVSPAKNLWHCLGACQVGGSVIDWVMKAEAVSFRHAVELLRSGDARVLFSPEKGPKTRSSKRKLEAPLDLDADDQTLFKQVVGYYHERLLETPAALDYLKSRGIGDQKLIEKFQLGFADRTLGLRLPNNFRVDGEKIRSHLVKLGLYRESGHEHFNGSIVMPVMAIDGTITEIYGRKITPKLRAGTPYHTYLPGPHRGIWNPECVKAGEVILCEALIDAATFWVNGFQNVTASYGVEGFTDDHLTAFIRGGVRKVFIAYDRDEAGERAAEKLALKLSSEGIECRRVHFPKGMDANEYACQMKPASQALRVCLEAAAPMSKKAALISLPIAPRIDLPTREVDFPRTESSVEMPAEENRERLEEGFSSLAAAPVASAESPALAPVPAEIAPVVPPDATPAIRAPLDVPTEMRGEDIIIRLGEREYRVRGLTKNLSFELMKVNLRSAIELKYHVDTLDLYQAKARTAYIHAAALELEVNPEVIKRDLGRILFKLEELQEIEIRRALTREREKKEVELSDTERDEALALLRSPALLDRILADFTICGVIGEETNKCVGYLAATSRKLDDPLAVIIQSSSAAGKSSLMEAVLAMMPSEETVKYSAMTGQSLFYLGEKDLKHRILAIAEEQGATQASYALKLLQSEGEISIASTGKDGASGRLVTHQYRVEGPVMIFLTTTAIEVDEELLNRCMVLTVNETREQTRAIHDLQRRGQTIEGLVQREDRARILKIHQNAQRLLRTIRVANPFADRLTFLDSRTRTRRDHIKYLTLIRTIALLHQYQREVKKIEHRGKTLEYIEVTARDIEIANRLCHQVLGRSLDELPPQTRKLLSTLTEMVEAACQREKMIRADYRFTRREVRAQSGWSDFQVQVHMNKLVALEYVLSHRGGRGQSFVYELLFDGKATDGTAPLLMGLMDPAQLTRNGYDSKSGQLTQSFEHSQGGIEGPSSPQIAPIEGSSRSLEKRVQSGIPAQISTNALEKGLEGVSESAGVVSYASRARE